MNRPGLIMAVLSIGCVLSIDEKDDCFIVRLDNCFMNIKTLLIKPPVDYNIKPGDCIVYTTDPEGKRIINLVVMNDVNDEILTHLEILKAQPMQKSGN